MTYGFPAVPFSPVCLQRKKNFSTMITQWLRIVKEGKEEKGKEAKGRQEERMRGRKDERKE